MPALRLLPVLCKQTSHVCRQLQCRKVRAKTAKRQPRGQCLEEVVTQLSLGLKRSLPKPESVPGKENSTYEGASAPAGLYELSL